jgi:hypothetical protein
MFKSDATMEVSLTKDLLALGNDLADVGPGWGTTRQAQSYSQATVGDKIGEVTCTRRHDLPLCGILLHHTTNPRRRLDKSIVNLQRWKDRVQERYVIPQNPPNTIIAPV